MITIPSKIAVRVGCLAAAAVGLSIPSYGQIVLRIDTSDPANVTFTATAINSAIAHDVHVDFSGGITLEGFFTTDETILSASPLALSGNLTGRNSGFAYNEAVTFIFSEQTGNVKAGKDVSIYYNGTTSNNQQFVTSAPPFTGVDSANMSAFEAGFPSVGTQGTLDAGYLTTQGGVIGQWVIVPEPSETALAMGLGVGAFALLRRFRTTPAAKR